MIHEQACCHDEAANHQLPIAAALLNHLNSSCRRMFKRHTEFDADLVLYLLSHFECDGHTVHVLTQWRLPPPLTSTVKSSLFAREHSSPLSSAARLHRCHANCCCYINKGWTLSRQTLYISILVDNFTFMGKSIILYPCFSIKIKSITFNYSSMY